MFENVDGQTTDDGVTGILIAHLRAFGSGELIIVNNNNFDFIASRGTWKPQPSESRFQLIFIGNLWGLQASLAIILKIKDKWRKSLKESYLKIC